MGTPGEKSPINKVVHTSITSSEASSTTDKTQTLETTNEMTILRDIPSLGIFLEHQTDPSPKETPQKSTTTTADKEKYNVDINLPGPSGLQKRITQKKPHLCSICNKNFSSSTKLITHELTHTSTTPFKCENCKKSFTSKFKLVRHVLIHSDRKPFSCTVCERTFHRKDHLKNHIKVHSPSKKIYTCEKTNCRKEYTSVMSFRKHLALHSAEEGSLDCKICFKTFATKEDILFHLKIHAGSRTVKNPNEKKFTCDYCERKFFTRKDVRRHLVVHTGTRNFLCQFCPQRFGRKDHLVRHIKKSHSTNYSENEDNIKTKEQTVENILFPQNFPELSPMLCSESEDLQYLPHVSSESEKLELLPCTSLPSDTELLTELVVMKEELEQQLSGQTQEDVGLMADLSNPQLIPEMIDTDILRLIESGTQLTEEEQNLPLPGFSQAFQQPP